MPIENVGVIKAEKYVALALAALERELVLPVAFARVNGAAFVNAKADTVYIDQPSIASARDYEWRTRTAPIVLDKIVTSRTSVSIGTHVYSGVPITDEQLTLDIENFTEQVLNPQIGAVANKLEAKVAQKLSTEPFKVTNLNAAAADDAFAFALKARKTLNQQGTPQSGRILLVGANVEAWLLQHPQVVKYDPSQATSAFREAQLGRIAGFDILTSSLIGENAIYALHPSALVTASIAPAVPTGVTYGANRTFRGYGMRVIRDYDSNYLQDRSIVSSFFGVAGVHDELALSSGNLVLDADGNATYTNANIRGAKGVFTPAA